MTIRHTHIAGWIPRATNTHWEYVILIAFTRQQWFARKSLGVTFIRSSTVVFKRCKIDEAPLLSVDSHSIGQTNIPIKVHYSISVTRIRSKQRWGADPVLGQVSWMPHLPAGTPLSSMTVLWDPLSHSCVYSVYQLDCVALCCDSNVLKPASPQGVSIFLQQRHTCGKFSALDIAKW